ncbi:hypothetical protein ACU5P1_23550 [Pseudomonas plecoglossicida]|nr:hypothetical protein [Pseudomonas plecoglossicida]QLB57530.1 hypothetical protein HAV28_23320 [Pseudomonas plecoglossicida]
MNAKMRLIAKRMDRQAPAPVPVEDRGVGAAIERLITDEVERRVDEAVQKQPPARVQQVLDGFNEPKPVTDYRELPPIPRTRAPKASEISFDRDEFGRLSAAHCGNFTLYCQRNELGQVVRMVPSDIAPLPPVVRPAAINEV